MRGVLTSASIDIILCTSGFPNPFRLATIPEEEGWRTQKKERSSPGVLSPIERRARNRAEMTTAILDAAREVMREQGAGGLTLQEVARRVNLRTPSLYEYFPNKAALYDALFRLGLRLYQERRGRLSQTPGSVWDRIQAWMEAYMSFAHDYPELYRLVFERPVPGFVPSEESMAESRRLLEGGRALLAAEIEEARLTPALPVAQALDLLIAMMHGLTSQHMANEPDLPVGAGRYGSLVPEAVSWFRAAWERPSPRAETRDPGTDTAG